MFVGDEKSGKTTLLKRHFVRFFQSGDLPVYLSGSEIKRAQSQAVNEKLLRNKIAEQYKGLDFETVSKSEKLVILIDDFEECQLNTAAKIKFLKELEISFDRVICCIERNEEMTLYTAKEPETGWPNFQKYILMPAAYSFRYELVRKWLSLGREHEIEEEELAMLTNQTANQIDDIFGRNFIPKTPFFIIVLLQALTVGDSQTLADNTAVRCYKYLIDTHLLREISDEALSDLCYQIFPVIAYAAFCGKDKVVSSRELESILSSFFDEYAINDKHQRALNDYLKKTNILNSHSDGYKFSEKYIYYYFLSEYLEKNKNDITVKEQIEKIFQHLYLHENSSIIIFLAYITKDADIVERILAISSDLLSDAESFSLETSQTAALNNLLNEVPKITIKSESADKEREKIHKKRDKIEREIEEEEEIDETEVEYTSFSQLDTGVRLNTSFKICQILGQLLKNSHASRNADQQIALARDIYKIAMKSLNLLLDELSIHAILNEMDEDKRGRVFDEQSKKRFKHFLFVYVSYLISSFAHCTARFVGDQKLSKVFERLLLENNDITTEFLNTIVMLDYYEHLDAKMLSQTAKHLSKNALGISSLRYLTKHRLYIRPENDRSSRQRIISIVGLDEKRVETIHQQKKLKSKS